MFLENIRGFQQLGERLLVENWFVFFLGHDSVFHRWKPSPAACIPSGWNALILLQVLHHRRAPKSGNRGVELFGGFRHFGSPEPRAPSSLSIVYRQSGGLASFLVYPSLAFKTANSNVVTRLGNREVADICNFPWNFPISCLLAEGACLPALRFFG